MRRHTSSLVLIHLIELMPLNGTSFQQFCINQIAATNVGDESLQPGKFAVVCDVVIVHEGQALTMKCNRVIAIR